eukprot:gnl/MRDRNA2_/MRDRNA2_163454_c0_seq1.p1 gnl/MRDRNA2_/MRDRNA2_163454_c0~~gnl/MRDRNA2_/MRDRNA2_163454_c0_seq1.p1  ORF type:complete len:313 (+),score=60.60 gnl/MRDRNA2_/MRDRNA2_163454_c0_seq1:97-1035(+)
MAVWYSFVLPFLMFLQGHAARRQVAVDQNHVLVHPGTFLQSPGILSSTIQKEKLASFKNVSRSEGRQDVYVYEAFFQNMTSPGVVLEMGVIDGMAGSNSLAFQKALDWHAILIEANPTMKASIEKNRKGAEIHMNAICSESGNLTFLQTSVPALNCFEEYAKADELERKMKNQDARIVAKIPVECKRLDGVGLPEVVDMFFLDVEGSELTVLETMDFDRTCVRVFNIESGDSGSKVGKLMVSKGFKYLGPSPEVSWDHVWVNSATCRSSASIEFKEVQKVWAKFGQKSGSMKTYPIMIWHLLWIALVKTVFD